MAPYFDNSLKYRMYVKMAYDRKPIKIPCINIFLYVYFIYRLPLRFYWFQLSTFPLRHQCIFDIVYYICRISVLIDSRTTPDEDAQMFSDPANSYLGIVLCTLLQSIKRYCKSFIE